MPKIPRRTSLGPPRSQWETTLGAVEGTEGTQAGEIEPGDEDGGGGTLGLDNDTGDGGYGGDAVQAGHDEAFAQTDRPLDGKIPSDPSTREADAYTDDEWVDEDAPDPGEIESLDEFEEEV